MNVLILVMSAQRAPWGAMIGTSMDTWDSCYHPEVDTKYYIGPANGPAWLNPQAIISPFSEDLHDLGRRTLHAYEHALTIPGWKFIARVNSSCYVHKRLLVEYCATLPETGALVGVEGDSGVGFLYLWGGGQYILSRDVVEKIVANKERWNHEMMEDVAVSRMALDLGIPWDGNGKCCSINRNHEGYISIAYGGEGFAFNTFAEFAERNDNHFIRVKYDPDRTVDLEWMRELKANLKT